MMMLDVCPSGAGQINEWDDAVNLTSKWAKIAHDYYNSTEGYYNKEQLQDQFVRTRVFRGSL